MKRKKLFLLLTGVILVIMISCGVVSQGGSNDLGLTRSDMALGDHPDIEALRSKVRAVADSYLAQKVTELKDVCPEPCELSINYSLKQRIRSLGYKSSFYYSHWDIYLPYSLRPQSNKPYIFIVQVGDTNGDLNDPNNKFSVIRCIIIDQAGSVVKRLE